MSPSAGQRESAHAVHVAWPTGGAGNGVPAISSAVGGVNRARYRSWSSSDIAKVVCGAARKRSSARRRRSGSGTEKDSRRNPAPAAAAIARSDHRSSADQQPKSSTTEEPPRRTCTAVQIMRPSSTSRLPSTSDAPKSGFIHSSGVSRRSRCRAANSRAQVVFPVPGSPTVRCSVGPVGSVGLVGPVGSADPAGPTPALTAGASGRCARPRATAAPGGRARPSAGAAASGRSACP